MQLLKLSLLGGLQVKHDGTLVFSDFNGKRASMLHPQLPCLGLARLVFEVLRHTLQPDALQDILCRFWQASSKSIQSLQ